MPSVKVAILEDHLSIIDGYVLRLREEKSIEIVAVAENAEELDSMLALHPLVHILIMDLNVPVAKDSQDRVKIAQYIPFIVKSRPTMDVLVISMENQPVLVKAMVDAGVSGYIFKEDSDSIRKLPSIVRNIASGQTYFPDEVRLKIDEASARQKNFGLTTRQLEILAKCAQFPDATNEQIAIQMGIAHSTVRNLLSESYLRLKVRSKVAAITQARALGLIP